MVDALRKLRAAQQVLFRAIRATERFVLSAGILAMAAVTVVNVGARTLFNNSLTYAEELNRHLIILVTFTGLSYAVGRARHIRMSAIFDALKPRLQKGLIVVTHLVNAGLCFALMVYAIHYIRSVYDDGTVTSALQLPLWATYLPVPIGLGMAGLQYALALLRNATDRRVFLSFEIEHGYEDEDSDERGGL